jgi:hypothetical protein
VGESLVAGAIAVLGSAVLAFVLIRDHKSQAPADLSSDDTVIAAH